MCTHRHRRHRQHLLNFLQRLAFQNRRHHQHPKPLPLQTLRLRVLCKFQTLQILVDLLHHLLRRLSKLSRLMLKRYLMCLEMLNPYLHWQLVKYLLLQWQVGRL
jgi:hypothetical protein